MESHFEKLKKEGKNDVDELIKWMQDSKIIKEGADEIAQVKKKFEGSDPKNVTIEKFKEVIDVIAKEKKTTTDELNKSLTAASQGILNSLKSGAATIASAGAAGASAIASKMTVMADKLGGSK